jgi:hypothetical protein
MRLLEVHVSMCPLRSDEVGAPSLITMVGELSACTVDDVVRGCLLEYVRFARHAILDLAGLEMVDDRGAMLLDELGAAVADLGGSIGVHNPAVLVEHVIRFCGVSDRITICAPA